MFMVAMNYQWRRKKNERIIAILITSYTSYMAQNKKKRRMRCSINVSLNLLRWVVKTSIATLKSLSTGALANIRVFFFNFFLNFSKAI